MIIATITPYVGDSNFIVEINDGVRVIEVVKGFETIDDAEWWVDETYPNAKVIYKE